MSSSLSKAHTSISSAPLKLHTFTCRGWPPKPFESAPPGGALQRPFLQGHAERLVDVVGGFWFARLPDRSWGKASNYR